MNAQPKQTFAILGHTTEACNTYVSVLQMRVCLFNLRPFLPALGLLDVPKGVKRIQAMPYSFLRSLLVLLQLSV